MLRLSDTGGEKPTTRTSLDDTADVRDILGALIGKGVSSLQHVDTQKDYARLQALLGTQKAQKLMTQVFLHNTRNSSVPKERRLQDFYEVGSNEPEVNEIIKNVKSFGYGVLPGFRESSKQTNQMLTGVIPGETAAVNNDAATQKVMLRLNK